MALLVRFKIASIETIVLQHLRCSHNKRRYVYNNAAAKTRLIISLFPVPFCYLFFFNTIHLSRSIKIT